MENNIKFEDGAKVSTVYHVGNDLEYADSLRIRIQDAIDDNDGCLVLTYDNVTVKVNNVVLLTKDDKYVVKANGVMCWK